MIRALSNFRTLSRQKYSSKKETIKFSQPTETDLETFSRELTTLSNQEEQNFSSDDLINPSSSGFQFDLFHYADFIQSMNRYESFELIYRQVRGKFTLSPEQFYSFKFTMECLREVIARENSINQDEEDFFQALRWVVKTKGLEANTDGINMRVVKTSSVIQDILYLLIHYEKTLPDKSLENDVKPESPKYVGLIFTNHPCGLNKDETTFRNLLLSIEKLNSVQSYKKEAIKIEIKNILKSLLEPSIEKLKPKVRDETLTLQDQLMNMSKTLVEQMEDSDDIEVRLDTWTGIEADRNATTPELQMQTVILNKMKGFEVYEHHLSKMISEIILIEVPEESDIPADAFAYGDNLKIGKETQAKKKLQDFQNMELSEESMNLLNIFNNSLMNFKKFEKSMQKGLDISKYLARLIVFRWIKDLLNSKNFNQIPDSILNLTLKEFYESSEVEKNHKNSYIGDTIQQFFSELVLKNLLEDVASIFLPKVFL